MVHPSKRPPYCKLHLGEQEPVRCKYFEIGLGRTATRSVWQAACTLGLNAMHGTGGCVKCLDSALDAIKNGETDCDLYRCYEYVGHFPNLHWEKLADERPDAKFILTTRPTKLWLRSARAKFGKTHLRDDPRRARMLHMKMFGTLRPTEEELLRGYTDHLKAVMNRFHDEPDRLLIVDVFTMPDELLWSKLTRFFGLTEDMSIARFPDRYRPIKRFNPRNAPPGAE